MTTSNQVFYTVGTMNKTYMKKIIIILLLLANTGCQKYYISIAQESIDASFLASNALQTPDPRQTHPPIGERLIIEWRISKKDLLHNPALHLHVIYQDYTEQCYVYPIRYSMDYAVYSLLNESYKEKKGILTYCAEIKSNPETTLIDWKHQLWTQLITFNEEDAQ